MDRLEEMLVDDLFDPEHCLAHIVDEPTPFREVVETFASRDDLRAVFVVDDRERLVGVVTRHDMLAWVSLNLDDASLRDDVPWRELLRMAQAATAADACRPGSETAGVRPDQPLEHALQTMMRRNLVDIPVLDEQGHVLGDLRLSQILAHTLRSHRR